MFFNLTNLKGKKVLISSSICQEKNILNEFLKSLKELDSEGLSIGYCFIDDNKESEATEILENFRKEVCDVVLLETNNLVKESEYICDEYTHRWNENLIERVAYLKNKIIKYFLSSDYDYIFFIDSDIILHPLALKSLIISQKDIISNIFWTKWSPESNELPQVWLKDEYTLYNHSSLKYLTQDEINSEIQKFLDKLRKPGIYKVGGLGACTLIKRKVLEKGVNFDEIYNISFFGEDRYFCIRAVALGFDLYVDTHYPAYHIYRREYLNGIENYKIACRERIHEIIRDKSLDLITKYLKQAYSLNYKNLNIDYEKFFIDNRLNKEMIKRKEREKIILKEKISSKFFMDKCIVDISTNLDSILVDVKLIVNEIRNEINIIYSEDIKFELVYFENEVKLKNIFITNKKIIDSAIIRDVKNEGTITLSMIVKNEEHRYLKQVLSQSKKYIRNAVIIDDGSTDNTVKLVKEILGDIEYVLIENDSSMFNNEIDLRKLQWEETIKTNPDWILSIDSDEIFEKSFEEGILDLINSDPWCDAYSFRLYDFWNEDSYREDLYWNAHSVYRTFLIRYQKNFIYEWIENPLHCGRLPYNITQLENKLSDYRIKHYGWAKEKDREEKYKRYIHQDPNGIYGNINQYESILDNNPNLVQWKE
ncbi:MAG: glycosyltransferase [Clostridium sp.]